MKLFSSAILQKFPALYKDEVLRDALLNAEIGDESVDLVTPLFQEFFLQYIAREAETTRFDLLSEILQPHKLIPLAKLFSVRGQDLKNYKQYLNSIFISSHLSVNFLQAEKFSAVIELDSQLLSNEEILKLLNQYQKNARECIKAINLLFRESGEIAENFLCFTEDIENYLSILERLDFLAIDYKGVKVSEYSPILRLDLSWFDREKQKQNQDILRYSLRPELFSPLGMQHFLRYVTPKLLEANNACWVSDLVSELKEKKHSEDFIFQCLQERFSCNVAEQRKFLHRLRLIFDKINANENNQGYRRLFSFPAFIAGIPDKYFADTDLSQLGNLLKHAHERFFSVEGMQFLQRILQLDVDLTEEYLDLLNDIMMLPQENLFVDLEYLSDVWLSLAALKQLVKFSQKYFTPRGLIFISGQDPKKLTEDIIQQINHEDAEQLLQHITENQPVPNYSVLRLRNQRGEYIDQAINQLKQEFSVNYANFQPTTWYLISQNSCGFSFEKLIGVEKEKPAVVIREQPLTIEDLKALCLIKGYKEPVYRRDLVKKYIQQNINHPIENQRKFFESDIEDLTAANCNLVAINQVYFLENLKSQAHLHELPLELFSKTPALLRLPWYFFSKKGWQYLTKHIGDYQSFTEKDFFRLEMMVEYQFFPPFTPEIFSGSPYNWFDAQHLSMLARLNAEQLHNVYRKGVTRTAEEDVMLAYHALINGVIPVNEVLRLLEIYSVDQRFDQFLSEACFFLTEDVIRELRKAEDARCFFLLCEKKNLISYESVKKNLEAEIVDFKKNILTRFAENYPAIMQSIMQCLKELKQLDIDLVKKFTAELGEFAKNHLALNSGKYEVKLLSKLSVSEMELKAFEALFSVTTQENCLAISIRQLIGNLAAQEYIGTSTMFADLDNCCRRFVEEFKRINELYKRLIEQLKNDQTGALLALFIQEDILYEILSDNDLMILSSRFQQDFPLLMRFYRREDLTREIRYQTDQLVVKKVCLRDLPVTDFHLFNGYQQIAEKIDQKTVRRITSGEKLYQLIDLDLLVGIRRLYHMAPMGSSQANLLLPLEPIEGKDSLMQLQELFFQNPQAIFFGILNVGRKHYFSLFAYKGQVLIIDPAFPSQEKTNNQKIIEENIRRRFPFYQVKFASVIQQFNDSDCGFSCLQTCEDLLLKGAVSVQEDRLVLLEDKLTLCARAGEEERFLKQAAAVRKNWEDFFKTEKVCYGIFGTEEVMISEYSYVDNQKFQYLKRQMEEEVLNKITTDFADKYKKELLNYLVKVELMPVEIDKILESIFQAYQQKSELYKTFVENCEQLKIIESKGYNSEGLQFNANGIEQYLLNKVQEMYKDLVFDNVFLKIKGEFYKMFLQQGKLWRMPNSYLDVFENIFSNTSEVQLGRFQQDWKKDFFKYAEEHIRRLIDENNTNQQFAAKKLGMDYFMNNDNKFLRNHSTNSAPVLHN